MSRVPESFRRRFFIVVPLLLLLFCLGTVNWLPQLLVPPPTPIQSLPTVFANDATSIPTSTRPTPSAASTYLPTDTAAPLPTETIAATATLPPTAEITLLGPPQDSVFMLEDTVSFYWQLSLPLSVERQLNLYFLTANEDILVGSLAEPNLGDGYRIEAIPADFINGAEPVRWQVRLETLSQTSLLRSESRAFRLIVP